MGPFFPFLNLPLLAIGEVLKSTAPLDIFQLLSVSRKTGNVLASLMKRIHLNNNSYKLKIGFENSYELEIKLYRGESLSLTVKLIKGLDLLEDAELYKAVMKIDGIDVPVRINNDDRVVTTYWESQSRIKVFLQHFCKLFNPHVSVDFSEFGAEILDSVVLEVTKNENTKLDELSFSTNRKNDLHYQKLLDLPISKLNLMSSPSEGYQYKPSDEPMKFDELKIDYSQWVTNIEVFLDCKKVFLRRLSFKEQEMKEFLTRWIALDCQLEFLFVTMEQKPDLREMLEGLPVEPLYRAYTGRRFQNFEDGECFRFQRNNGEKAIIYQNGIIITLQTESYRYS